MSNEVIETTAVEVKEDRAKKAVEVAMQTGLTDIWTNKATFDQVLRAAQMLSQTQIIPQQYQGKPQDCFLALEMAHRTGLPPLTVLQNLYVVKGKPSWSGQACLALINSCGRFRDAHPVYVGERGTDSRGCYVTAVRVSDGTTVDGPLVDMNMAKGEGWTSNSKWRTMPELMLSYRASAFFARTMCPEALMGCRVEGEWEDIPERPSDRAADLTAAINAEIAGGKNDAE